MKIAIVGAGGFAREVEWLIKDIGRERAMRQTMEPLSVAGFLVSDPSQRGKNDSEALGDFSWLRQNRLDGLAMGIGNPTVRLKLAAELQSEFPNLKWPALIHPSVKYDSSSCTFAEGVIICAGNILTVNVRVERFAMINLSCTVGHETIIGEGTVINPLCAISGGVKIGKKCLIGTHSAILQDLSIGDGAVVASGAMVHRSVLAGVTVMGVPAKSKEI
jgi:sugar O-acyltransferase (sialic acid O-acetyltransferase NeuD family)